MAIASETVGGLVESVAFMLTNTTSADSQLAGQIKKNIGWVIHAMVMKSKMPAFRKEGSITTVSGTSDYDLPDDFEQIIEPGVYFANSPKETLRYYREVDRIDQEWQQRQASNQKPYNYTTLHRDHSDGLWQMRLVSTPDAAYDINFTYFSTPTPVLKDTSDATEIDPRFPRSFLQGVVNGVCAAIGTPFWNANQIAIAKSHYDEAVDGMRRTQTPVVGNYHQNEKFIGPASIDNLTNPDVIYTGNFPR